MPTYCIYRFLFPYVDRSDARRRDGGELSGLTMEDTTFDSPVFAANGATVDDGNVGFDGAADDILHIKKKV